MRLLNWLGFVSARDPAAARPPSTAALSGDRVVDEHFTPGAELDIATYVAAGDLTAIHHLVRYYWARAVLAAGEPPARILDLGSGSGYGAFLLAQALPEARVIGADYDPQAVAQASRQYHLPNLEFAVGDPTNWEVTLGADTFDAITCFDVIEHVVHRELLLEGVVGHLRHAGQMLFSTPCASNRNNLRPDWEHHRIEYSTASLYDFLRRYFSAVERSEDIHFPERAVFEALHARGILYELRLNPVICREPIAIPNPYRA
jgi:2-polyprenyl-3-methyl-5-hydroxy-6-metoxy-1,4-benzoquinol methylase